MNELDALAGVDGSAKPPRPRPMVHFTAPIHWLNDPNGVVYRHGEYHMFFQHNPGDPMWAAPHWGHARSPDLVAWTHLPIALAPDSPLDINGCFSGCFVDDDGTPTIIYTAVGSVDGLDDETVRTATSDEQLVHWSKAEHPLLTKPNLDPPLTGYRDPHVWHDGDVWRMIVGGGSTRGGRVLLYESPDLRTWRYIGLMYDHESSDSALTEGRMWECPQLIRLGDVDVLLLSILDDAPRHVVIVEGNLVGDRFVPRRSSLFDAGSSLYAPYAFLAEDGSHRVIGWLRETEPEHDFTQTWAGAMTLPRSIRAHHQHVQVLPSSERISLRSRTLLDPVDRSFADDDASLSLSFAGAAEIHTSILLDPGEVVTLTVTTNASSSGYVNDVVIVVIDVLADRIDLHRHRQSTTVTSSAPSRTPLPTDRHPSGNSEPGRAIDSVTVVDLTVVVDQSIIEISTADGRWLTERLYSHPPNGPLRVSVAGTGTVRAYTVWSLAVVGSPSIHQGRER